MDIKKLKKIFEMVKENDITELNISDDNFEINIKRGEQEIAYTEIPTVQMPQMQQVMQPQMPMQQAVQSAPQTVEQPKAEENSNLHKVLSPINGTYYSSPAPSEPEFVKIGDHIEVGQTVCIVEAMKIMNEIKSDVSGTLKKILVKNEDGITKDQVLMLIE